MPLIDLASLSSAEFKQFLDSFDNVLCDCDGVIFPLHKPIENVKESLLKLRQCGKHLRFVTNNNMSGLKQLVERFNQYDFKINAEDMVYPSLAMMDYLKSINFDKDIYLIGFPSTIEEFKKAGFKVVDLPNKVEDSPEGLKVLMKHKPNIGAVILDVDLNLNYPKLFEAAVHLMRPDVVFITGATDKGVPVTPDLLFMGPGYFQDLLADFVDRKPLVFGKPGLCLSEYVIRKFNIQKPCRTLFVGDTLEQDVGFATTSGFQSLLVLTGVTNEDLLRKNKNKDWIPNYYINSFGDLNRLIREKLDI